MVNEENTYKKCKIEEVIKLVVNILPQALFCGKIHYVIVYICDTCAIKTN